MNEPLNQRPVEVLWVEDNWGDVLLMKEAFQENHLRARLNVVTDGEEAMAFLNHEAKHLGAPSPDIILLDLNLPRMDGRALLRRLKRHPRFNAVPIVVLTSSRLDSDMREAFDMDANGYIVKPVDLSGFLQTTKTLQDFWFKRLVSAGK
jgi:CheY-like chemotaxis protein